MRENDSFHDITFIHHPADIVRTRRIVAQLAATGVKTCFNENEFGSSADGVKQLKEDLLRAYTVAFVMSPDAAESQLCNELLQYAVSKGKRLLTLILEEEIAVEVHPAIAQNPFVFFRAEDELAARVDELRAYLPADDNLKLHTQLLVRAEIWRERGRPADLLLSADRLDEARNWLATAAARLPKPSALQLEYIHSSRRQPPSRARPRRRQIVLAITLIIALGAVALLLGQAVASWQSGDAAGALTNEARAHAAIAADEATAASDSAFGLIDQVAATSAGVRIAVAQTATAESITAAAAAQATQTAIAQTEIRATRTRVAEIAAMERVEVARRLVQAGEEALEQGEIELSLALAWEAKDALENPRSAYRLLRRAASSGRAMTIDGFYTLRFQPGGDAFALVPQSYDKLRIYDNASWTLQQELTDHDHPITTMEYSRDGRYLITGATDGEIIIRASNSGEIQHRLSAHQDAVTSIAVYPQSDRLVSAGRLPHLAIWDLESGEQLAEYAVEDAPQRQFGGLLVTADEARVIGLSSEGGNWITAQWSAKTLEWLTADSDERDYRGYDAQGRIGYTGGRSFPAYPGDPNTGDVRLWNLSTGERIARLEEGFNWSLLSDGGLTAAVDELLFISFQKDSALLGILNSDAGQWAALIDISSGSILRRFDDEIAASLKSAELLGDGSVLSATSDKRALLWSSVDGRLIGEIGSAPAGIESLRANAAANLVIARTADGAAHFWPLRQVAAAEPLLTISDSLPGASISPSGGVALLVEEDSLRLQAVDAQAALALVPASRFSSAGRRFTAYSEDRLSVFDIETGAEVRGWEWDGGALTELHLAPDGLALLAFSETSELWLARDDAEAPLRLTGDALPPALVRFAPAGDMILTLQGELALLWDGESGEARAAYPLGVSADAVPQAAFSEDGDQIFFFVQLAEGLAGLTAIDLADNRASRQTFVDVVAATLSADGLHLSLAYGDGRIQVRSTSGAVVREFQSDASDLRQLRYLPESNTVVASAGSQLIFWDAAAGALERRFAHAEPLAAFSLSADAGRILTRDESGVHRLWQVESAEDLLERVAADYKPRELTCREREQYLVAPLCE